MFTLDNPYSKNLFPGDEVFVHKYASYGTVIGRPNEDGYVRVRLNDGRTITIAAHKVHPA